MSKEREPTFVNDTVREKRNRMTSIKMPNSIGTPDNQLQITTAVVGDYLTGERLESGKAQIAAQQMHSLQDWTIRHRLTEFGSKNADDFRNRIYSAEPRLTVIRDFANATKHGGFLKNDNRVLDEVMYVVPGTTLHTEGYVSNGKYLEMDDVLKECLEFWEALYDNNQIPSPCAEQHETESVRGANRHRIQLPEGINSTADQLTIAEQMTSRSSNESTPGSAYLAATTIAPLEHWGFEDLTIPMENPIQARLQAVFVQAFPCR